ncbi:FAD binding domain-containing protein [Aspergillus granulosus]|uniref:FAD binding domain-containing protein n=1 Tax=Aspergillus granulosus TaxID=176169 RepID=A0ABR4H3N1_9EURO
MYLIHFKSRDLSRLHSQGQFWHIFMTTGDVIISQNEKDTWTVHRAIPLDADISKIGPREAVYAALAGENQPQPYHIDIDEVLVTSTWRPNICVAARYTSDKQRVFLAGDSAHQNIPTGGYGMNTAVGDSFDIGWKLAAAVHGHGGSHLLGSYERERRPVAVRNIERSGVHWGVHSRYKEWCAEQPGVVTEKSDRGDALRKKIKEWFNANDGENRDMGIEMGYRYSSSTVVIPPGPNDPSEEPPYLERDYVATTWPGSRVPHVFLQDGITSTHDVLGKGPEFTLVDFTADGSYIADLGHVAEDLKIPFKTVHLPREDHVRRIWERDAVLVRPDDHVAWRASLSGEPPDMREILLIAVGRKTVNRTEDSAESLESHKPKAFSSTIGNVNMDDVKLRAEFQL